MDENVDAEKGKPKMANTEAPTEPNRLVRLEVMAEHGQRDRDELAKQLDELHNAVYGSNGNPGMLTKIDRNTEILDDIKKLIWLIIGGLIGIAITEMWYIISTHPLPK